MVCIMSLSVPVVFAIDVVDNLEFEVILVDEGIFVGTGGNAKGHW